MKDTSSNIQRDNLNNKAKQEELLEEINQLRVEIQEQKKMQFERDKEHEKKYEEAIWERDQLLEETGIQTNQLQAKKNSERQ